MFNALLYEEVGQIKNSGENVNEKLNRRTKISMV
jgi:hypothetical protein